MTRVEHCLRCLLAFIFNVPVHYNPFSTTFSISVTHMDSAV